MESFVIGFSFCLGLIVAIGAQNAWVLTMSVRNQHPWIIAIVCSLIDASLMACGILFLAWLKQRLESIVPWFTLAGILLLSYLILQSLARAVKGGQSLTTQSIENNFSPYTIAIKAASISLLNPHVYLDTVILVGNIGINQPHPWIFWIGGALASTLWFCSLAAFGKPLRVWLTSPARWRLFDLILSFILIWVTISLTKQLDIALLLKTFH